MFTAAPFTLGLFYRAHRWQIPTQYRAPNRQSDFCYCPSFNITTLTENSDPGDEDPLSPIKCFQAYSQTCFGGDPQNNLEILDFEGRTVCEVCDCK